MFLEEIPEAIVTVELSTVLAPTTAPLEEALRVDDTVDGSAAAIAETHPQQMMKPSLRLEHLPSS